MRKELGQHTTKYVARLWKARVDPYVHPADQPDPHDTDDGSETESAHTETRGDEYRADRASENNTRILTRSEGGLRHVFLAPAPVSFLSPLAAPEGPGEAQWQHTAHTGGTQGVRHSYTKGGPRSEWPVYVRRYSQAPGVNTHTHNETHAQTQSHMHTHLDKLRTGPYEVGPRGRRESCVWRPWLDPPSHWV